MLFLSPEIFFEGDVPRVLFLVPVCSHSRDEIADSLYELHERLFILDWCGCRPSKIFAGSLVHPYFQKYRPLLIPQGCHCLLYLLSCLGSMCIPVPVCFCNYWKVYAKPCSRLAPH